MRETKTVGLPQLLSRNEKHDWQLSVITLSYFSALPLLSTFSYPGGEGDCGGVLFMAELASILHLGCLC